MEISHVTIEDRTVENKADPDKSPVLVRGGEWLLIEELDIEPTEEQRQLLKSLNPS